MTDTPPGFDGGIAISTAHRELLDQVLDKWSLSVLNLLCEEPRRFNDLRRAIPSVTQKSLTATLRKLERNGILQRVLISSRPVAVQYRMTPLGRTLRHPVLILLDWAESHMSEIEQARRYFDDHQSSADR
jgi:DNA-binding HxlR family transcriptional regulator